MTAPDVIATPTVVSGWNTGMAAIAIGQDHVCGLDRNGAVTCWGSNDVGQLGYGGGDTYSPVAVAGLPTIASIAVGDRSSCALTTTGVAYCWGEHGDKSTGPTPVAITSCP
jgi:alpha-tubulin suppressor-like RCC1 family protein